MLKYLFSINPETLYKHFEFNKLSFFNSVCFNQYNTCIFEFIVFQFFTLSYTVSFK